MSEAKSKVVILGGGTGGVIVANLLGRKAKKQADVTLVSKQENVFYEADLPFRVFDQKGFKSQYKLVRKVVNKNVTVLKEEVVGLDVDNNSVTFKSGTSIPYDYLVIATGAHYDFDAVPGFKEGAYHYYNEEGIYELRKALDEFVKEGKGGEIFVGIADLPFKCPVAPLEGVFMMEHYLRRKKLRKSTGLHYLSPIGSAFSIEQANVHIEKKLEKKSINLHTFFNTETIHTDRKVVESLEGDEMEYDLLIMVPPHSGQKFLHGTPIVDESGWVNVNTKTLQNEDYPNIFAIGDAANLPVSKAGSSAHYQAMAVAHNLGDVLKGKIEISKVEEKYNGHATCLVMTSLTSAMFFDFTYNRPPFGLGYISNRLFYYVKKFQRFLYFYGFLSGRI
ncbi:MAG: NAD(P)/FAD-dependent oxidoreductase [Candidatus Hodarchaeales archaeon]|jgi:sulfide:quinone oxidoreductase